MIGKIDPIRILQLESTRSKSLLPVDHSEFNLILQGKLDHERPLEAIVIEYLLHVLESLISRGTSNAEGPSFAAPSSYGVPFPSSSPNPGETERRSVIENDPVQNDLAPEASPEASKSSQEGQDFEELIERAARAYGVDSALIRAVIKVESNGNPSAVSPAGARGLMQLMPGTALALGVSDPFDPGQNIRGGTRYLRQLLDRYRGDTRLALAAYNWGMGNLEKRPDSLPRETQNFILKVERQHRQFAKFSSSI